MTEAQADTDRLAVLGVVNLALDDGWGMGRLDIRTATGRTLRVRVTAARRWVHSALRGWLLVVSVHDDTPHYCPAPGCRYDRALTADETDRLLLALTAEDVQLPGRPVLRGGRLA